MTVRRIVRSAPPARLGIGLSVLALAGAAVQHGQVGRTEDAVFRAVNGFPDGLRLPTWALMQGGNLAAVPVTALVAAAAGRTVLARRLLLSGAGTWALAKVVKAGVRRPRPGGLLPGARLRGRPQTGQGFVSGHAGVAAALCTAALPELGPEARCLAVTAAAAVAVSRLYVGAHLPLDAVGGVALGIVVEAAVEMVA